ncbi:MAG: hypothetical protein IPJ06_00085 [Saprospiraceae bacterium]|nr:hypothetical protein [Saprospiraceae bacterium]
MKHWLSTSILFLYVSILSAQFVSYTYVSDRKFQDPTDLIGWQFRPSELEIPDTRKSSFGPGEYSFGVTQNNLFIEGPDIAGVYSINNINPADYGYILNLMNARNPTLQGHLKVILNKYRQADAVIFKRSPNEKEIIFWLPLLSQKEYDTKGEWYTDRRENFLADKDSLWGSSIMPFLLIDQVNNKQQILSIDDSTSFRFTREIEHTLKKKKLKKKEVDLIDSLQLSIADLLADSALLAETGARIETQIVDYLTFKTRLLFEDGGTEWVEKRLEIKSLDEKVDKNVSEGGEKYMLEVGLKNGEFLFIFLDTWRHVSSLEWGPRRYLMRGN